MFGEVLQDRDHLNQLSVCWVIVPRGCRDSALRVEEVRYGRVVNDDLIFQLSVCSRKILYKDPVEKRAVLSKESVVAEPLRVKPVEQWVRVLR